MADIFEIILSQQSQLAELKADARVRDVENQYSSALARANRVAESNGAAAAVLFTIASVGVTAAAALLAKDVKEKNKRLAAEAAAENKAREQALRDRAADEQRLREQQEERLSRLESAVTAQSEAMMALIKQIGSQLSHTDNAVAPSKGDSEKPNGPKRVV